LRRPGAYPRVDNIKVDSIGKALTLPANIRIGWKDLAETSIIDYYKLKKIKFYNIGPTITNGAPPKCQKRA
jgi:hypothetical protein